jgi:hypothetical protein
MNGIVAAAGNAGHLIGSERVHEGLMNGIRFEVSSAAMVAQALVVVKAARNGNVRRGRTDVLHVDACHALQLVLQRALNCLVGMAGVTRSLRRYAVILKVLVGQILRIIDLQTLPVIFLGMTGNAELGLFRALHVREHSRSDAKRWEDAQGD